jgi:acid phosphatase type 7
MTMGGARSAATFGPPHARGINAPHSKAAAHATRRRRVLGAGAFFFLFVVVGLAVAKCFVATEDPAGLLFRRLAQWSAVPEDPHRNDKEPRGSAFPSSLYHNKNRQWILPNSKEISRAEHRKRPLPPSCRPQRVRVAQRNDTDSSTSSFVSMTLSFELDRVHCPPTDIDRVVVECREETPPSVDDPNRGARTVVVVLPEGEKQGVIKHDLVTTTSTVSAVPATTTVTVEPVQFDYQTESMRLHNNEIYRSDYIYHVPLEGMRSGRVRYAYRISVVMKQDQQRYGHGDSSDGIEFDNSNGGGQLLQQERRSLRKPQRGRPRENDAQATHDDDRSDGASCEGEFVTPPSPSTPTRLALVGDLGQTWYSTLTMLHIWKEATGAAEAKTLSNATSVPVTNLVIAGDMSYADSDPGRWTSWFELMEPLLRTLPAHVVAGNHELECDRDGNLFTFYEKCFVSPNRIRDAVQKPYAKRPWEFWKQCSHPSQFRAEYDFGNAYYSYEHGLAKVVVLSSYSHTDVNSTQYQWLHEELSTKFRRDRTPWLIAVFHSPFYTTFLGHREEEQAVSMRAAMEDLFVQYGVNLVVSGHDHAYLRTHPVYRGQVVPSGRAPVYWTLGAGGNREGHSQGYAHATPEPWVAKRSLADFGYGSLYMPNATHAQLTWMRDGVGIGLKVDEMAVEDDVWIVNPYTAPSNSVVA